MEEKQKPEGSLAEEFRELGKNLTEAMHAAWDSPERKRLQEEISNGLNELGNTLRDEARHFKSSPAGMRIKAEAEEVRDRIRSGEMEGKARSELVAALHKANDMLRQAIEKLSQERGPRERADKERSAGVPDHDRDSTPMKDTGHREVHPDDVESDASQGSGRQEVHPDDTE
jgi:hypothetical protein